MPATGKIFNIQKFSINDGPGIRTTVFFKGCPLSCRWCHNPESQAPAPELWTQEARCLHCGACARACAHPGACTRCGACEEACPQGIPLTKYFKGVSERLQGMFAYMSGRSPEEPLPFVTFLEDELKDAAD